MTFVGRLPRASTAEQLAGRLHGEANRWHERLRLRSFLPAHT